MQRPRAYALRRLFRASRLSAAAACALALAPGCASDQEAAGADALRVSSAPYHPTVAEIQDALSFGASRVDEAVAYVESTCPGDPHALYPVLTETSPPGGDADPCTCGDGGRPAHAPSVGLWRLACVTDWRSGFFPGVLWQLYRQSRDPARAREAEAWSEAIATLKDDAWLDYDLGNRFMASFGQAYRLLDDASDPGGVYRARAKDMIVAAAASLDQRFDEGGIPVGAIRSLDDYLPPYPVYIDGMMNLELLFEGWNASGRPSSGAPFTWYQHAIASAATTMEQNVRANGSTYHIVQHDDGTHGTPPDGMIYDKISDQGYAAETTWSRGQAWAIYGFTMVYRYTRDDPSASPERFLSTAKAAADYFVDHLPAVYTADPYDYTPGDFVPPTDFDAALGEPVGPYNHGAPRPALHTFTERDSSAAAAAASGLLELGTLVSDEADRARYIGAARQILASLPTFARDGAGSPTYLATGSPHRGILAEGSMAWGAAEDSIVFGDYYFLEALARNLALASGGEVVSTR